MKLRVKTIIIITKKNDHSLIALTKEVTEFLLQYSKSKKDPYTMYLLPSQNGKLIWSYVDQDFESAPSFDYEGLKKRFPSSMDRIKFWSPELCLRRPHLFDFVITVPQIPLSMCPQADLDVVAGRRRHSPLHLLALPTRRPARSLLLPRQLGLPNALRLLQLSTYPRRIL